MKFEGERILFAVDMAGTLLFAVEGASAAIGGNLDLLGLIGLMVLAFATALGGGIVRDVLIGAVPPAALRGLALRGRSLLRRHHPRPEPAAKPPIECRPFWHGTSP
jgi:hypothetical protein